MFSIPYQKFSDGAGGFAYEVALDVSFALPHPNAEPTKAYECIVDSGATGCLFDADIAASLGLDLYSGTRQRNVGISGFEETWLHRIALFIPGGPVTITAAFKENLEVAGLLGMSGFFEHYTITFDSVAEVCLLDRHYRA